RLPLLDLRSRRRRIEGPRLVSPAAATPAAAFVADALTSSNAVDVMRALRGGRGMDPKAFAVAVIDEAETRLRRDPRLAFWLGFTGSRAADRAGAAAVAARGLYQAGEALANQGRMRGALRLYDRAIGRFHGIGSRSDLGAVLIRRIRPLSYMARHE